MHLVFTLGIESGTIIMVNLIDCPSGEVMEFNDLRALEEILNTLEPLKEDERVRVLRWCVEKLGIETGIALNSAIRRDVQKIGAVDAAFAKHVNGFHSIGDFVAAARARTDVDRVLAAALYLQDLNGDEPDRTLTGKEVNDTLKHLGHGVKNITDCINTLKGRKPQHMIQVRKGGKAQQAWKQYRVTDAGSDYVFKLIRDENRDEET
jgi:hypothetical protein